MSDNGHNHNATFERCLRHLMAKGFDAGAAHRICYSVNAGGEVESAAPTTLAESATEVETDGVSIAGDHFTGSFVEAKTTAESRVIENIVLCGAESPTRNRTYPRTTLEAAAKLYEGAKIYLNHPRDGMEGELRDVRDLAGSIVPGTVRVDDQGRLRGSVKANTLEAGNILLGLARECAAEVGMSHNAIGVERIEEGRRIVEVIAKVRSVDVVTEPGTTKGLHESKETKMDLSTVTLAQLAAGNPKLVESIREEGRAEVREREVKPLKESAAASAKASNIATARSLVEAALAKPANASLPDRAKTQIREGVMAAAEAGTQITEKIVDDTISRTSSFLAECGVKIETRVTESAASIPATGGDGKQSATMTEAADIFGTMMGVPKPEKK